jgi:uncharacterized membrane protein
VYSKRLPLLDVIYPLMKQLMNMVVKQRIKHVFTVPAGIDNAQCAQKTQMMGHCGLAHAQHQA